MTDIFISYCQDDREKAKALAELLVRKGYNVWWDVSLLPGQNFADEINTIIGQAKAVIVLWTNKSVNSMWVKSEATLALEKNILIPVWLEQIDLPIPYNNLQTLDLAGWSGQRNDVLLNPLLSSIESKVGENYFLNEEYSEEKVDELLQKPAHEVEFWKSVCDHESPSIEEYETYLERYGPEGTFAKLAKLRIDQLVKEKESSKLGFHLNKGIALAGVLIGILVGVFQIADMLGWLPKNKSNHLLEAEFNESCKSLFENNCGKGVCTSLRLPDFEGVGLSKKKLNCGEDCIKEYENILLKNHISYLPPSAGASYKHAKCVGFREDLGGSYKGAECLVSLLGEEFKVGNCKGDGWPYNIYLY